MTDVQWAAAMGSHWAWRSPCCLLTGLSLTVPPFFFLDKLLCSVAKSTCLNHLKEADRFSHPFSQLPSFLLSSPTTPLAPPPF
jgi:hypothetical protein